MTTAIIITLCVLLLFAYVFDITSSKTKIPSVILLLALGWSVKLILSLLEFTIPDLTPVLPILGTIGLILIVLEGSLELDINKTKLPLIGKSSIISLISILVMSAILAYAFNYFGNYPFRTAMIYAVPFSIISSAVAIPSAKHLILKNKEFITYESSLSDIFGVIIFNFFVRNVVIDTLAIGKFFFDIILILIITFVATLSLAFLLSKIKHHVKFAPIILMIILIYVIAKEYHLPALIYILLFGLFLGNLNVVKENKYIRVLQPELLVTEIHNFKKLTSEVTFLIRALFFLLFGYLINTSELLNTETLIWSISITAGIFLVRFILLKLFRLPLQPLLYIAPRGLITILLFLSVPAGLTVKFVNNSMIIQIIILTSFALMFGMMKHRVPEQNS